MSLKADFWKWIEQIKGLNGAEIKELKKLYGEKHREYKLYNFLTPESIQNVNSDGSLDLYYEFMLAKTSPKIVKKKNDLLEEKKGIVQEDAESGRTREGKEGVVPTDVAPKSEMDDSSNVSTEGSVLNEQEHPEVMPVVEVYSYMQQCEDRFAEFLSLPKEKEVNRAQGETGIRRKKVVFDLSTAQFFDLDSDDVEPMVKYVAYKTEQGREKIYPRAEKSFTYTPELIKMYSAASDLNQSSDGETFIQKSIADTKSLYGIDEFEKSICLVPDTLSDFKDSIKSQLRAFSGKIVAIPRSIAAAYSYAENCGLPCGSSRELTVYDFNLLEPSETHIIIEHKADGELLFIRKKRIKSKKFASFRTDGVLDEYIEEFARENKFFIPGKLKKALVETRDILSPLWGKGDVLLNLPNGEYKKIGYSEKIAARALKRVLNKYRELIMAGHVCVLSELNCSVNGIFALPQLSIGCKKIAQRLREGKVIWKEYLPELSLEVIQGGRFQMLSLIKKDEVQNISENSMEERIYLSIDNGKITLPAGESVIRLPLKREEFGDYKQDKMAKFSGKGFPLIDRLEVDLRLSYSFGDPDSYLLEATGKDGKFSVQSQWCDSEEEKINEVVYPVYDKTSQIRISKEDIAWLHTFLDDLSKRLDEIYSGIYGLSVVKNKHGYDESNLFKGCKGHPLNYRHNLLKKITEFSNFSEETNFSEEIWNTLIGFFESQTFSDLFDYLINPSSSWLFEKVEDDKKLKRLVDISVLNFMSNLGVFYCINDASIRNMSDPLLDLYIDRAEKWLQTEYLISASRCISHDNGIMNILNECVLEVLRNGDFKQKIKQIRNISSVCWYNEEWILYFRAIRPEIVPALEETVWKYMNDCFGEDVEYAVAKNEIEDNTLTVRDVMELALALCRLREKDKNILDSNKKQTKEIVAAVKRIDDLMHDINISPTEKFVSRVKFDGKEKRVSGLWGMSDPCYLLITQLIGKQNIKLIGFEE